jgi:hypothetical protein
VSKHVQDAAEATPRLLHRSILSRERTRTNFCPLPSTRAASSTTASRHVPRRDAISHWKRACRSVWPARCTSSPADAPPKRPLANRPATNATAALRAPACCMPCSGERVQPCMQLLNSVGIPNRRAYAGILRYSNESNAHEQVMVSPV